MRDFFFTESFASTASGQTGEPGVGGIDAPGGFQEVGRQLFVVGDEGSGVVREVCGIFRIRSATAPPCARFSSALDRSPTSRNFSDLTEFAGDALHSILRRRPVKMDPAAIHFPHGTNREISSNVGDGHPAETTATTAQRTICQTDFRFRASSWSQRAIIAFSSASSVSRFSKKPMADCLSSALSENGRTAASIRREEGSGMEVELAAELGAWKLDSGFTRFPPCGRRRFHCCRS